ncbi:MAG: FAD:protein FMN transferase [Motiliproteus sp.]
MKIAQQLKTVFAGLLVLALVSSALTGCSDRNDSQQLIQTLTGATMGTSYTVKVVAPQSTDLVSLKSAIQSELDRIESRMSTYKQDSELSIFNHTESEQWFSVSVETARVVGLGLEISAQTQGAFDMTVGPLVNLWGFGPGNSISKSPSQQQIDELLPRIGYQAIAARNDPPELRKTNNAYLDLSAIAKGYAVDVVADLLSQDYGSYLVEIGGELKAHGLKPDGTHWRIAVESPSSGQRNIQKIINVENTAIATSGDYRNYFEQDGVRFSHTIDPATGKPITHRLASVTILDPSCARADALATAMMVLGKEKGLALAKQLKTPAFFISKSEQGFVEAYTDEFESFLMQ